MGILHPHKPSDYPSTLLYILDETHLTLTLITAGMILYTKDAHVLWFSVGALSSSLSAKGIKHFIRSPRPPPPEPTNPKDKQSHIRPKKTFGMPSTHSTALSFYFFYLVPTLLSPSSLIPFLSIIPIVIPETVASLVRRCVPSPPGSPLSLSSYPLLGRLVKPLVGLIRANGSRKSLDLSSGQRLTSALGVTLYWLGGLWSRVELGYHTYEQVLAGAAFGWFISALWRGIWMSNPGVGIWIQGWMDHLVQVI